MSEDEKMGRMALFLAIAIVNALDERDPGFARSAAKHLDAMLGARGGDGDREVIREAAELIDRPTHEGDPALP